jgi:hypothetical protein
MRVSMESGCTYLSELYETSLDACNVFIYEFCRHVRILYGRTLAERVEYLSLDEQTKQLIGILRQLGNDDLLAPLDGITLYRLDERGFRRSTRLY